MYLPDQRTWEITLQLHNNLIRYAGERTGSFEVPLSPLETLRKLIQRFQIPFSEIGVIVLNNTLTSDLDSPLHPGDSVKIFGLIGGG